MSARTLRGSCHCGRNQYVIQIPEGQSSEGTSDAAQISFELDADHRVAFAVPLSAFIRVPLAWYNSETFPFFPDESTSSIRRVFSHPREQHTRRQFCGYCGTPLSYWSEQPRSEADYIRLTLGSLLTDDLHDLEEMGLLPEDPEQNDEMDTVPISSPRRDIRLMGRELTSVPWFDSMISGSRLGNMHTTRGVQQSRDGRVRVEFEITEWNGDDQADEEAEASESSSAGKRKRSERDDGGQHNLSAKNATS